MDVKHQFLSRRWIAAITERSQLHAPEPFSQCSCIAPETEESCKIAESQIGKRDLSPLFPQSHSLISDSGLDRGLRWTLKPIELHTTLFSFIEASAFTEALQ